MVSILSSNSMLAQKKKQIQLQWEITAELPADSGMEHSLGFAGPVTGVSNNLFFIGGGANFPDAMPWEGGKKKYHDEGFIYKCKKGKLVLLDKKFKLPTSLAYPASCTTSEGVFFAGGENENGLTDKVWMLQWDKKMQRIIFKNFPPLPFPVTNASATIIANTIYIAGGETVAAAVAQFICLDLDNIENGWKQLASIPHAVSNTVLISSPGKKENKIYLCGGRKKNPNGISDLYADVFEYDVAKNNWKEKAPLPYALSAGTGAIYNKNRIILFGGDKGTVFHQTEFLIAAINNEKNETKRQELILQKNKLQLSHPGFSNEVLQYHSTLNTWQAIGTIPYATPVTTTAVIWKKEIIIPSGEIKAGVRSPNILQVTVK